MDALRGLAVAAMVLVNNAGALRAVYPPLRLAEWSGWNPTDMILPFFVFIVGVAIPLALAPRLEREGRTAIALKVVRRSIVIFALGSSSTGSLRSSGRLRSPVCCSESPCAISSPRSSTF